MYTQQLACARYKAEKKRREAGLGRLEWKTMKRRFLNRGVKCNI